MIWLKSHAVVILVFADCSSRAFASRKNESVRVILFVSVSVSGEAGVAAISCSGAGYMWEAQLLQASVMPLRVGGSLLVAAGTAAQFVPPVGSVVGGIMIAVGAALSAFGNSIHVDAKTGKRSYQMTDQGAMNTLVDVIGGATGGAVAGNAVAAGNAAAANGMSYTAAALEATKAGSAYAMAVTTGLGLVNSGMEYDSRGRYTGNWSLEGARGDNALIGTAISFAAAGAGNAMKLPQGSLASDLTRSGLSTGMHMMVQYQKMLAGHENSYAAMAEADFSDLGSILGTMMQSQSRDWQNDLSDWAADTNDFNQTQRMVDLMTGAGVFGRRDENGNLVFDAPVKSADTAWGRFWEGGMSTLGGYGALAGVIGEGLGAVWDGLKYVTGFSEGGFWEKAVNFFQKDRQGERWLWETDQVRNDREMKQIEQEIDELTRQIENSQLAQPNRMNESGYTLDQIAAAFLRAKIVSKAQLQFEKAQKYGGGLVSTADLQADGYISVLLSEVNLKKLPGETDEARNRRIALEVRAFSQKLSFDTDQARNQYIALVASKLAKAYPGSGRQSYGYNPKLISHDGMPNLGPAAVMDCTNFASLVLYASGVT